MKINQYSEKIAKGALISFLGMILGRGLTYLYVALVARLGSAEYGLLSLGFATTLFLATLALLGMRTGIIRYISYYLGKKDNARIKGTILTSIKITLPISLVFMALLFLLAEKVSIILFHNPNLIPILKLFSLTIPFIVLSNIFINVMLGYQKIGYQVGIKEIIENLVKLILTFILIYFGYNLFGAAIAYLASILITFLLSFYILQKKVFPLLSKKIKSTIFNQELLMFSLPLLFGGFSTLAIKWADVLMIGYFKTASDVGIYNIALPTANLLTIVPTALMALFLPVITNLYSKNNKKEIKNLVIRTSKWIFFVNLSIFIMLFIFSEDILRIMFGQEYVAGKIALLILIFGYLIHSLSHVNSALLVMLKKTKILFFIGVIASLSNIILNLILIPAYGIIGGAISTSFSLILTYMLYTIYSYKLTKIFALKLIYLKFILIGLITSIIMLIIKNNVKISLISLILLSLLLCLIYLILSIIFKSFDNEDKNLLTNLKNKFVSKI